MLKVSSIPSSQFFLSNISIHADNKRFKKIPVSIRLRQNEKQFLPIKLTMTDRQADANHSNPQWNQTNANVKRLNELKYRCSGKNEWEKECRFCLQIKCMILHLKFQLNFLSSSFLYVRFSSWCLNLRSSGLNIFQIC